MKQCDKILRYLMNHKEAGPFLQAVDWEAWGLVDYPRIIKHPMDMGTIRTKLAARKYATPEAFAHDVRLVWKNCRTYNQDGSQYYNLAVKFSKLFETRFRKISTDAGGGRGHSRLLHPHRCGHAAG